MNLKFLRALIKGKLGNAAISIIDKNRGTNWAGEHAMFIDPEFLAHFKGIDPEKVLFITKSESDGPDFCITRPYPFIASIKSKPSLTSGMAPYFLSK